MRRKHRESRGALASQVECEGVSVNICHFSRPVDLSPVVVVDDSPFRTKQIPLSKEIARLTFTRAVKKATISIGFQNIEPRVIWLSVDQILFRVAHRRVLNRHQKAVPR